MPIDKERLNSVREQVIKERADWQAMIRQGEAIAAEGRDRLNRAQGALLIIDELLKEERKGAGFGSVVPEEATEEPDLEAAA